ncbi:hypothetical protein DYB32_006353 [Aphanomyces invadans]|uniref:Uncharacterized protein n=1 Tax=Aphanomyces invadans TaxID=157072 RepID=A0A418AS92_9STRA|nr:hypothetical protein DYB32_006353 [Aphanomyces invadans]
MPEDIAVIVNTYKPCIVCHELLGVDGLSYCLDCTKYFHGLCLKGSTIPLNCSSCERTRDASNTASKYKNERVLGEYIRVGPLKNLFQYRMTLLHRYTHPHLYKGLKHTAKPSTPLATPVKASPKSKSAAGKKNHKKKAPFRGVKDSTTTQIGANEADDADAFFELTSDPVALPNKAVDSPRKKPRPDDRVTAIAVGLEDDEARDNGNDALDGSDSNALPNETDITAPPQPSAVQETVENLIEMVLVKVDRHPDGSILEEASTADFSDLREFHGIPLVTSPLVPLRPVPTPTPRGAHDLEDVPMLFENIVDDEHHEPAEVTESYESAWPAGMMPDSTAVAEHPIAASEDRKNA